MFYVTINNSWRFYGYCFIYWVFDSFNFAWNTQWIDVGVLGDLPGDVSFQVETIFTKTTKG